MRGSAVPIIKLGVNSNKFEIDKNSLNCILSKASDENCEIAVISIAGAFRQGKSFLLNFFIHYLESITILGKDESVLLNDLEQKFNGFNWKRGIERQTSGILIWSEIFYYTMSNGKQIGILLMDTQGLFDNNTSASDNVTVFALSNLLASVQIYNLSDQIHENDLQHLQLFLEYGKLALNNNENSYGKPFQQVMFLIRDWANYKDYKYGEIEGTRYVDDKLKIGINQHEELKTLRSQIRQCFEKINGFLLPSPGNVARTSKSFDGKLKDLDQKFREGVTELLQSVLAKQNIRVKKINGRNITIKEFKHLFFSYWSIFEGDKLPSISTIFNATAEAVCIAASDSGLEYYKKKMDILITDKNKFIEPSKVQEAHESYSKASLNIFSDKAVFGDTTMKDIYRNGLQDNIKTAYGNFLGKNNYKKTMDMSADLDNLNNDIASIAIINQQTSAGFSGIESAIKTLEEANNVATAFIKEEFKHQMLDLEKRLEKSEDARTRSEQEKQELIESYQNKIHRQQKEFDNQKLMEYKTKIESLEQNEAGRKEQEFLELKKQFAELEENIKQKPQTPEKQNDSFFDNVIGGISKAADGIKETLGAFGKIFK